MLEEIVLGGEQFKPDKPLKAPSNSLPLPPGSSPHFHFCNGERALFFPFQYDINIWEDSASVLAFCVVCKTTMKSRSIRKERHTFSDGLCFTIV